MRGASRSARGVSFNPNPSANFVGTEGDKLVWRSTDARMYEPQLPLWFFVFVTGRTSSPPFRLVISSRRRLRGEITGLFIKYRPVMPTGRCFFSRIMSSLSVRRRVRTQLLPEDRKTNHMNGVFILSRVG